MSFLSVREASEKLHVSIGCVYQLIAQRKLACHRIGTGRGAIRIREDDLDQFLNSCRISVAGQPLAVPQPAKSCAPVTHLDGERLRRAWKEQGVD